MIQQNENKGAWSLQTEPFCFSNQSWLKLNTDRCSWSRNVTSLMFQKYKSVINWLRFSLSYKHSILPCAALIRMLAPEIGTESSQVWQLKFSSKIRCCYQNAPAEGWRVIHNWCRSLIGRGISVSVYVGFFFFSCCYVGSDFGPKKKKKLRKIIYGCSQSTQSHT